MSHRVARLLVALVVALTFAPLLLRGEVLFAHDNTVEVGLAPPTDDAPLSNRKFNDQSSVYVPEIHHHLNGRPSGWISTWNPHVECGRPTTQVAGFGKAYWVTHLLSFASDDALVVATWQALLAVALTALFAYLLATALGLRPEACLVAALGIALGVFHAYWLTFPLFLWTICWSLAILWLVARFVEAGGLGALAGIAFAVHGLLLSGYPQLIVWHGYLITGFVLWRLARRGEPLRASARRAAGLSLAAAVGVFSVLFVYADVALAAQRSARLSADTSFFLEVLPRVDGWRDLARFLLLRLDPFWLGNPIAPDFPLRYNGLSATPLLAALAATTLRPRLVRRLWPAQLFCAVTLVMTLWPAAYAFGVEHLGLHVSRTNPLAAAIVPGTLLAAYGAHALLAARSGGARDLAPPLLVLAVGALAAACAAALEAPLAPGFTAAGAALFVGALAFAWLRRPLLLVALAVLASLHYAARLPLARPPEDVHRSSPLVELVRSETDGGRLRFAWVAGGGGIVLPPNQEAFLGLRSIHSYNSLSSRAYQDWVLELSTEGTQTYGRHFHQIATEERLEGPALDYAGIGLFVSGIPLRSGRLEQLLRNPRGGGVYRLREAPALEARIGRFSRGADGALVPGPLSAAAAGTARRVLDRDDRLRFELDAADDETLLFVSQQFHPQWTATADGRALETVPVNGFYQGVLVPPRTTAVELSFRPWVRWAWLPQAVFAAAGALFGLRYLRRRSAWFGGRDGVATRA